MNVDWKPYRRVRQYEYVFENNIEITSSWRLKPGNRFPSEKELSRRLRGPRRKSRLERRQSAFRSGVPEDRLHELEFPPVCHRPQRSDRVSENIQEDLQFHRIRRGDRARGL